MFPLMKFVKIILCPSSCFIGINNYPLKELFDSMQNGNISSIHLYLKSSSIYKNYMTVPWLFIVMC